MNYNMQRGVSRVQSSILGVSKKSDLEFWVNGWQVKVRLASEG
jgi:hypothetical protein